jgi:L-malate glycosyltransferase
MPAPRIRLLEFVNAFGIGGTERHVVNLGRALARSCFDLSFGCLKRWGDLLDEVDALRAPVAEYRVRSLYPHRTLRAQVRFARDLRSAGVDIVHAYNVYANIFAIPAARMARVPVVLASIRDTGVYLSPGQRRVQRAVCRLADGVLVNAEAVRRWLIDEGYPGDRVLVIRNGVDLSRFARRGDGGGIRSELRLPATAPLVAVLARLDRNKGIEDFLDAAAVVAARTPAVRFLVVGDRLVVRDGAILQDVDHREALEARVRRLGLEGRVLFTGFRRDVAEILSEVRVSVLPSLSEGLPNAVLESMAAGVPVVATRVGGIPEVIEDGENGLLVPPSDPAALARAILTVLENDDLARSLGGAGRRCVEQRFSLEMMMRRTEGLYVSMLEKARRGRAGQRHLPRHVSP